MELELKLARAADEFSTDFQIAKDRTGPLFVSAETSTMFIITVHLRGYLKRNIKIEISEDGTRIVVSGEKEVQETLIVGWRLHKKEKEIRRFKKAFKIPDGVILDRIRAKFDEDESIMTISMPKKERGIRGVSVEEVNEHELARVGSETLQIDDHETEDKYTNEDEAADGESPQVAETLSGKEPQENVFPEETQKKSIHDLKEQTEIEEQQGDDEGLQKIEEDHDHSARENIDGTESLPDESAQGLDEQNIVSCGKAPKIEKEDISQGVQGNMQAQQRTDEDHGEEESAHVHGRPEDERGRYKICTPIVAGSALLLSIVVFVIHFIRAKSQPGKRKD